MFTNKMEDGRNNRCGLVIARRRKQMGKSQRQLADMLQILGLDIDKNAVQRMESGQRFITDIELVYISRVLNVNISDLLSYSDLI